MVQCRPGWRELSNMFGKAGTVPKFVWISRVWTNGLLSYNAYVMITYEIFLTEFTHNFTRQCNLRVYLAALECFEWELTTTSVRSEILRKTVLLWLSSDVDSGWSSKGTLWKYVRWLHTSFCFMKISFAHETFFLLFSSAGYFFFTQGLFFFLLLFAMEERERINVHFPETF